MDTPIPKNEASRLQMLRRLRIMDTPPERRFDRMTELASLHVGTPTSMLSFVDEVRQWIKASVNFTLTETPREHAFCAHIVAHEDILVVEDALEDARFADNPMVTGAPHIRAYAGAPLRTPHGTLGALCVIAYEPMSFTPEHLRMLELLAEQVVEALDDRLEQAKLERSLGMLTLAERLAGVGHWRFDPSTEALYWSPQVYRIHGLDPEGPERTIEQAVGAYHPEDRPVVSAGVSRALETGEPFDFVARLITADGSIRVVRAIGEPDTRSESSEDAGIFGVFQDITAQQEVDESLANADKMATVGLMSSAMAHELNNPLTYIRSNLEMLLSDLEGEHTLERASLTDMASDALAGASLIEGLVTDLRIYAHENHDELTESLSDVARALQMAVRLCIPQTRDHAAIDLRLPELVPRASIDENQLVQVIINLIVNASQAFRTSSPMRNKVTVSASRDEETGAVTIDVRDNGPGMEPEVLERAFERFYTTKPRGEGSGLGLHICRQIIEEHGGTISARSTPGEGATFTVRLPAPD